MGFCRVFFFVLFFVFKHCIVPVWNEFAETCTPLKIGSCLDCFQLVIEN